MRIACQACRGACYVPSLYAPGEEEACTVCDATGEVEVADKPDKNDRSPQDEKRAPQFEYMMCA